LAQVLGKSCTADLARPCGCALAGSMVVGPSAAAAAGAAAAALLQRQLLGDPSAEAPSSSWSEHQTGDGRKFYFHEETQTCTWEKPEVLLTPEERANDTNWREYKIWDGRSYYHNKETKVSCWSMPPELRRLRGESSGIDDRPLPQTQAEKRRTFWELLRDKGVDETWNWTRCHEATRHEPQAQALDENSQKQVVAELLGYCLRQRQIQARERDRTAASAFERLIEDRFSNPDDVNVTYEEAARLLSNEQAWGLIKSDVRRDEVFQNVMERLEEKHKKALHESRTTRVVRLQRLLASEPSLKRTRLRWKDAAAILERKDELQEEDPPLEAMRVWASLRELRTASDHEAEARNQNQAQTAEKAREWREDRKRRDSFVNLVKELAIQAKVTAETPWTGMQTLVEGDPKFMALQEGAGATAMELYDEFIEELARDGPEVFLGVVPGSQPPPEAALAAPAPKRRRTGFSPAVPVAAEDNTNALDALIAGGLAAAAPPPEEEDEEDPLMGAVTKAAEKRAAAAAAK